MTQSTIYEYLTVSIFNISLFNVDLYKYVNNLKPNVKLILSYSQKIVVKEAVVSVFSVSGTPTTPFQKKREKKM
jgi:hypothetical protein